MKKIIFILIFFFLILLACCYIIFNLTDLPTPIDYVGWQSVSIKGIGTFKIPQDWVVTHGENVVFITDKPIGGEYKIYLVGAILKIKEKHDPSDLVLVKTVETEHGITEYYERKDKEEIDEKWLYFYSGNDFFINVQSLETVKSRIYSNSAYHGIKKYNINGNIEEKYYLLLDNNGILIELLSWDNLINESIIEKIAKSYDME